MSNIETPLFTAIELFIGRTVRRHGDLDISAFWVVNKIMTVP
jgi:hypothetical protein